jgi:hypothetical protein
MLVLCSVADCLTILRIARRFGNEEPSALTLKGSGADVEAWLSLVERPVRDRKVAGSHPVAPIIFSRLRRIRQRDIAPPVQVVSS